MSCVYPSCMMGGGSCSYAEECDREADAARNYNQRMATAALEKAEAEAELAKLNLAKARKP